MERSPDTITIGRVIRFIDGPLAAVPCVSQTAYARCDDCPDEKTCVVRCVMKEVRDAIAQIAERVTIADMCERARKLRSQTTRGLDYVI